MKTIIRKSRYWRTILFLIVISFVCHFGILANKDTDISEFEKVVLVRVVDGDTLVVLDELGIEKKVRLIGIDAPESVHSDETKNTHYGDKASEVLDMLLDEGETLYLEYDKEQCDKYGRYLAYVWDKEQMQTSDINVVRKHMLNGIMVYDGYAISKEYAPNTKYADILYRLEIESNDEKNGLWGEIGFKEYVYAEMRK